MFLCELSMTLCLVYKTKSSEQSSDTVRDAIKNKLSTYSLRWDPSDICTKTWTNCSNQKRQSERSFTPFVRLMMMDSSAWTVSEKKSEHMKASEMNTHLYTVCRQDSGSECNFYLFLMRRDATLAFSMIKCPQLSDWTPVGGAYGEKKIIRQCLALEACLCKCLCPVMSSCTSDPNEPFLELK